MKNAVETWQPDLKTTTKITPGSSATSHIVFQNHLFLGGSGNAERILPNFLYGVSDNYIILEEQAFYLGAALLLSEKAFSEDFKFPTLNFFIYFKRKWHVSIGAMIKRANGLNSISGD